MQAKDHTRTTRRITSLAIASLVLGGCLSGEEQIEGPSGGQSVNTPTNSAPVITGNPPTAVNVGGFYSFVPTASDADGDALTFSVENKPTWGSFNSGSGEVSGQPTLGDVGVYEDIRISVTDGVDSASLQPSLSINVCPPGEEANCCESTPTAYSDENGPLGNGTIIGDLAANHDTFHSIGFVWDIDGDADNDSSVTLRYRKADACNFAPAMPLVRAANYAWFWQDSQAEEPTNSFAGSLMFLTPGTTYEVVLELIDPDGGRAIRVSELTTRAIPRKPTQGRTLYVIPGSGGGDGSSGNPFRGIAVANAAAQPGDTMLLRDGTYRGTVRLDSSGEQGSYIVYEPDTGAAPIVEALEITGDYIWIDRLTFVHDSDEHAIDVPWKQTPYEPSDVVITNNNFSGYFAAVRTHHGSDPGGRRWTIMDNTIVGDKAPGQGTTGPQTGQGWGIHGNDGGHVIAYNRISQVADGIGSGGNTDVYGNDIFDTTDDSVTNDFEWENVRVWGNRMHDAFAYEITFQPQKAGPWYYLYNQVGSGTSGQVFKWRVQDRVVFVNNTFIGNTAANPNLMRSITRNNLWINDSGVTAWGGGSSSSSTESRAVQWDADWNTDTDYDGWGWLKPSTRPFVHDGVAYTDLASFSAAVGVQRNGVEVDPDVIFEDYTVSPTVNLTLNPSGNAVDAGAHLPNLADFYKGAAPDLGAHEIGAAPLHFGPRSGYVLHERELHWAKH